MFADVIFCDCEGRDVPVAMDLEAAQDATQANEVQREIKASGLDSIDRSYSPGGWTASIADYEIWYVGPQREGDYE